MNPEISEGYLGEAGVSTHDIICHAVAINITEKDIDIEVAPQEIIPFDFCEFPGEEFFVTGFERPMPESQGYLSFHAERLRRVKERLYIIHSNEEEKDYILR